MDFLVGVGLQVWIALQREVLSQMRNGLAKCVATLKCGCHDVAPHLAMAAALQAQPCSGGIKTGKTRKF